MGRRRAAPVDAVGAGWSAIAKETENNKDIQSRSGLIAPGTMFLLGSCMHGTSAVLASFLPQEDSTGRRSSTQNQSPPEGESEIFSFYIAHIWCDMFSSRNLGTNTRGWKQLIKQNFYHYEY